MSLNILEIDEEGLNKQILKEFNKTPENLNEYINIMREWAKTQPHFPEEPTIVNNISKNHGATHQLRTINPIKKYKWWKLCCRDRCSKRLAALLASLVPPKLDIGKFSRGLHLVGLICADGVALLRLVVLLNKFSIEQAKQKLDMYYTMRSILPEFYTCQPLSSKAILQRKIVYIVPIPKTTPDFQRILFCRVNPNYGPEFFDHEQLFESFINLLELLIEEEKCYNFHFIFDCKGVNLGHVSRFSPMVYKKSMNIIEKVYSNRIACICLVNFPKFMETFLNTIVKPVLKPKIRDRIKTFPDSDNLLKLYDKSIMPKDIGGDEKSLDELNDLLNKKFEERQERFEVLRTLRVNESLRPQKLINDDILGYYGNFKNINVD